MLRLLEAVVRRVEDPLATLDGLVSSTAALLVWLVDSVPFALWIAVFGLLTWRGHRMLAGIVTVLSLHVVALSGLWTAVAETAMHGLIVGLISWPFATVGAVVFARSRRRLRENHRDLSLALLLAFAMAITPFMSSSYHTSWHLAAAVMSTTLTIPRLRPMAGKQFLPRNLSTTVLGGLTAVLLFGFLSGLGIAGIAAVAAETRDLELGMRTLAALFGVACALGMNASAAEDGVVPSRDEGDALTAETNPEPS